MSVRLGSTIATFVAVAVTALAACSPTGAGEEPVVRIAFFQDLSVPEHVDLVSPSFLAFDLVVQRRVSRSGIEVEVVQLDTGGDPATAIEMAREVAADDRYTLAVAAPFWEEPAEVARILAEAGIPTMSLSQVSSSPWLGSRRPDGDPAELWRRFVPDRATQASLIADVAVGRASGGELEPVCLVADGSTYATGFVAQIASELGTWPTRLIGATDAAGASDEISNAGCRVVVWGGFPPGARDLAHAMRERDAARGRPVDLAGDALKTVIPPTSPAGDGAVVSSVACSCVDVSTDVALASRRFVNAYQSEHGLTPGIYAAEAWDAGRLAADAIVAGPDRATMRAAFRALTQHRGVARVYAWSADGELVGAGSSLYVASGTRWLSAPSASAR